MTGEVTWISSQAEFTPTPIQTREERADLVYAIKIRVSNEQGVLKVGMPADVHFAGGPTPMTDAVVVTDVLKRFGATTALAGVSCAIRSGELFGFIGPDGAGKTTLFRILTTLLVPDSGGARVLGEDVVSNLWSLRKRVGYMPGRFSLYPDLSVEENLRFFASVFGTTIAAEREPHRAHLQSARTLQESPGRRPVGRDETEARALLCPRTSARNPVSRRADDRGRRRLAP